MIFLDGVLGSGVTANEVDGTQEAVVAATKSGWLRGPAISAATKGPTLTVL